MILSATFSKPSKEIESILGKQYIKVKFFYDESKNAYDVEFFTQKQAFQKTFSIEQTQSFIKEHAGTTFKNCIQQTELEEITILSNKKGKITELHHKKITPPKQMKSMGNKNLNRTKNYIIPEGTPVPFLIHLGVMSKDGKVNAAKYDKFRQINRFLEYIADILPELEKAAQEGHPIRIADFGCGKSYLTFAVYYYLHELKKLPVDITGLDLKEDVIQKCSNLAKDYGYNDLHFSVGDISKYNSENGLDLVITLHACDTATDYALSYAVTHNARVILSVPCCQHEVNAQFDEQKKQIDEVFAPLLKYGIIKERFAALCTDAIRADSLEKSGYSVQLLEFIDMEQTPKNLLIRAVKKGKTTANTKTQLEEALKIKPTIRNIL